MDEDEVPPLLKMDGDNVAIASGIPRRPSLRLRSSNSSLNAQMYSSLRRSQTRKFSQTSMDAILPPRFQPTEAKPIEGDEHAATGTSKILLFFAVPVIAGLMFENGASITIDLVLVALAALMLYWSLDIPWQWYYYARKLAVDEWAEYRDDDDVVIIEESDEEEESKKEDKSEQGPSPSPTKRRADRSREWRMLSTYELCALASCFISPAAASYILHRIRQYLARPAGSPVENASFLLFVMAAELPPLRQVCKLLFAHTLYLQRVVASYDVLEAESVKTLRADMENEREELEGLKKRLEELEVAASRGPSPPPESKAKSTAPTSSTESKNAMQNQVNALNRAVRQYEKRSFTQQAVTEARLRELESRINDALTLAAAASRSSQRPNPVWELLISIVHFPAALIQALFAWPLAALTDFYRFLFGPRKKRKKRDGKSKLQAEFGSRSRLEER